MSFIIESKEVTEVAVAEDNFPKSNFMGCDSKKKNSRNTISLLLGELQFNTAYENVQEAIL
jgi:hypothetical protein